MPSPKYTNTDLKRFERAPLSIKYLSERPKTLPLSASENVPPYDPSQEVDVDQLLASAKNTLARNNRFSAENYPSEPAPVPDEDSVTQSPLARFVGGIRRRHNYAMSQPAEIALSSLAQGIAVPLALGGYAPAMVGQSAINLGTGGAGYVKENPAMAGIDVAMLAGGSGALGALKRLLGPLRAEQEGLAAARAAEAAAQAKNAKEAAVVRSTVEHAREQLAGGASRAQAAQRAGWPLGKSRSLGPISHNDVPISEIMAGDQGAFRRPTAPPSQPPAVQGLLRALETDPLEAYASGPRIERGMGTNPDPALRALLEKWITKGQGRPLENLNEAINTTDVRMR